MKTRKRTSMESTAPWYRVRDELAKGFNVHPDSLRAQYRLSSEKESAFPFGLNDENDFQILIDHLRPLSIPKKGRSSARKLPPIVNVFNNDTNMLPASTGSNSAKAGKVWKDSHFIFLLMTIYTEGYQRY